MRSVRVNRSGGVELIGVDPVALGMLQRLPAIARGDGSERFLSPDPIAPEDRSPEARGLRDDWMDLIVPDLHTQFDEQLDAVKEVLAAAEPSALEEEFLGDSGEQFELGEKELEGNADQELVDLVIPNEKIEEWYGALNQAKLALDARYDLHAVLEAGETIEDQTDAWLQAFHHFRFYHVVQMPFLELMIIDAELDDDEL